MFSLLIYDNAPIGALQPPSNSLRNSLSKVTQVSVSSWFNWAHASRISSSSSIATTIMAPWAGAGNIQVKPIVFSGSKPIRSKPTAAKIAPFQSLVYSFSKRLLIFPLKSTTVCVGYLFNHCACLRKLPVAITASREPKNSSLSLNAIMSM